MKYQGDSYLRLPPLARPTLQASVFTRSLCVSCPIKHTEKCSDNEPWQRYIDEIGLGEAEMVNDKWNETPKDKVGTEQMRERERQELLQLYFIALNPHASVPTSNWIVVGDCTLTNAVNAYPVAAYSCM